MKFKNLERFRTGGTGSKMQLGVPLPRTPKERVYRYSPNETAHPRHFVIGNPEQDYLPTPEAVARMKLSPRSKQTVCPYSGVVDGDDAFVHPDDVKAALETVRDAAARDVQEAFSSMFRDVARRSRGMLTVKSSGAGRYRPKPRFARRDLMRELVCDHCHRDYGVFAIGLFCPDCGAPNLRLHFAREAALVGAQVDMAEALGEGAEELAYRLLGNAHEDVLTAFEATLKTVYLYGMAQRPADAPPFKPVKNDFQNLDNATRRFAELALDPFDGLAGHERDVLGLNIQKRHIIGHNLGVVDERFAAHAADARIGETVHLVGEDIRAFARISQKVIDRLDGWLGGAPSPFIGAEEETAMNPPAEASPDIDTRLAKLDLELSPLARKLGLWIAQQCPDGMEGFVNGAALTETFGDPNSPELGEAIAELETDGLISVSRAIGRRVPLFRPTSDLYLTFDGIAFDCDPMVDAVHLAEFAVAGEDSVSVAALHASTGWAHRRFNPALAVLVSNIDPNHVSQEMSGEYHTRWFHLQPEDRVKLKRFIARTKG